MEDQFLNFAGIVAVGVIVLVMVLGRRDRKDVPATNRPEDRSKERVRRGAGNALLGLQGFIEPSVEHIFQVQNVEQREEDDDNGLGGDEETIRSDLPRRWAGRPSIPRRSDGTSPPRYGRGWIGSSSSNRRWPTSCGNGRSGHRTSPRLAAWLRGSDLPTDRRAGLTDQRRLI